MAQNDINQIIAPEAGDCWNWVVPFVREASKSGSLAQEVNDHVDRLLALLRGYDDIFWSLDKPETCLLFTNPPYAKASGNTPALSFNFHMLRDLLLGPGVTATGFLAKLRSSLKVDFFADPLLNWRRLDNFAKGDLAETVCRLVGITHKVLMVPVKRRNWGLDALSLFPDNGRLNITAIDVKSKNPGWNVPEVSTPLGALERIKSYLVDVQRGAPSLSTDINLLLRFSALCLEPSSKAAEHVDWNFVGAYSWPDLALGKYLNVRPVFEAGPHDVRGHKLKDRKPYSTVEVAFPLEDGVRALNFLLTIIAEHEVAATRDTGAENIWSGSREKVSKPILGTLQLRTDNELNTLRGVITQDEKWVKKLLALKRKRDSWLARRRETPETLPT